MYRDTVIAVLFPLLFTILLWIGLMLLATSCWSPEHKDIPDKAYRENIPQKELSTPVPTPQKTAIEFENDDLKSDLDACREALRKFDFYCADVDYD